MKPAVDQIRQSYRLCIFLETLVKFAKSTVNTIVECLSFVLNHHR